MPSLTLAAIVAAGITGYFIARDFVRRRLRFVDAIYSPLAPWIAGGLAPLLVPNAFMGTTQRIIHIFEILTQNASLGITAVLLLRPKTSAAGSQVIAAATL